MTGWDLLFPRRCPVCDRVQPAGRLICPDCEAGLHKINSPFCKKCGKPLLDEQSEYCGDCARGKHRYLEGRALYEYPAVRRSLYRFKYGGRREYAEYYGRELAAHLKEAILRWEPDALVPVPLHRARRRERGYNQAEALARVLGKALGIPVRSRLVKRVKKTLPQKRLDRRMRQNNLKRAFKISGNVVKLNTIIIIDDIYTTGSTIDAVASALQEAGVSRIYYISLAIGRN